MFGRNRPRARVARGQGRYVLRLDERERELIRQILGELRALLRSTPTTCACAGCTRPPTRDDAEKEDEYQRLTHEELQSGRLANVDAVEASIDAEVLSDEQLTAWMQAINSLRLVLGTLLDITDDDQELASTRMTRRPARKRSTGISAGCSTRSSMPS